MSVSRAMAKLVAKASSAPDDTNPEDILALAANPNPDDGPRLRELARQARWMAREGNVARAIPLRTWAEAVATFLELGAPGSLAAAQCAPETAAFHASVLTAAGTMDAALHLLALCKSLDQTSELRKTIGELNLILSFRIKQVPVGSAGQFREYLHNLIARTTDETLLSDAYLALRACGDESSLVLLEKEPDLQPPWEAVRKEAIRWLRKSIKKDKTRSPAKYPGGSGTSG